MEFLYYSALLLLEAYLQEMNSIKSLYANNQSSTIHTAQWQKQSKCPSVGECLNKIRSIDIVECYLVIKRNEALMHATWWMNPENITLSEKNKILKAMYILYHSPFAWHAQIRKTHRVKKEISGCQGLRVGRLIMG